MVASGRSVQLVEAFLLFLVSLGTFFPHLKFIDYTHSLNHLSLSLGTGGFLPSDPPLSCPIGPPPAEFRTPSVLDLDWFSAEGGI